MKYFYLILIIFVYCCQGYGQSKEVIYTLQNGEKVAAYENTLGVYQSRVGYVIVIDNEIKKIRKYCVNKAIYGPFNRQSTEPPRLTDEHWGLLDSKGDSSIVIFDGYKTVKYAANKHSFDLRIAKRLIAYVNYNQTTADYNVVANGFIYGPYINLMQFYLSPDGLNWAVTYYENAGKDYKYYAKFSDGTILGPYSQIKDFALLNRKQWIMIAEEATKPGKWMVINDKRKIGYFETSLAGKEYENFDELVFTEANYAINLIQAGKIFFMVNGELLGPYEDFVKQVDLGIKPDRVNFIVGQKRTLYFRDKPIIDYVRNFTVSDSRNSVAIIKDNDSLNINNKYPLGSFKNIEKIEFSPNSENFYFWTKETPEEHGLYLCVNNRVQHLGNFSLELAEKEKLPKVHLTPSANHWGFVSVDAKHQAKVIMDGKSYAGGFINDLAMYAGEKEYASWISLDGKNIVLNKVIFE